jgi:hypothetical protein
MKLVYEFADATNRPIARIEKEKSSFANAIVETMSIPIEALPTGVYMLNLKVLYPKDNPNGFNYQFKENICVEPKQPCYS